MEVIKKPFIVGGHQIGEFLAYTDVEPEFNATEFGVRVLPAEYFYEKGLHFYLKKRYEPGENKFFPTGGFEVRSEFGQVRNYELDQVIIHPAILKHKKSLAKMARRAEKETKKRDRRLKKLEKAERPKYGRRGRPALSPEAKAARQAENKAKTAKSGGKRGRPKSLTPKVEQVKKITSGKRGRPSLSPEEKLLREQAKVAVTKKSGGKRGRPASNKPKVVKEKSGLGRGRPPKLGKK